MWPSQNPAIWNPTKAKNASVLRLMLFGVLYKTANFSWLRMPGNWYCQKGRCPLHSCRLWTKSLDKWKLEDNTHELLEEALHPKPKKDFHLRTLP